MFQIHRAIVLCEHGTEYSYAPSLPFALINTWVLGKFILVGEALRMGERWHNGPLFYSILYKSAVFGAILIVCRILEEILKRMWTAKSLATALPELGIASLVDEFSLAFIVFIVLIPFFAARDSSHVLGKSEFESLLLCRKADASA